MKLKKILTKAAEEYDVVIRPGQSEFDRSTVQVKCPFCGHEMLPMTYSELKIMRSLVLGMRGGPLWESLELESLIEKLDAAIRRAKQMMLQELKNADAKSTR